MLLVYEPFVLVAYSVDNFWLYIIVPVFLSFTNLKNQINMKAFSYLCLSSKQERQGVRGFLGPALGHQPGRALGTPQGREDEGHQTEGQHQPRHGAPVEQSA